MKKATTRKLSLKFVMEFYWKYFLHKKSYAYRAEDVLLLTMSKSFWKREGFYVDVGASHPVKNSNSYVFYSQGWSGLNIDCRREAIALFEKFRPRDINVTAAVSDKEEEVSMYGWGVGELTTIDSARASSIGAPEMVRRIQTQKLSTILDQYLPKNQTIDFFEY